MIYPEGLKKGNTIGVTAASGGLREESDLNKLENAIKNINQLGFKVLETPNVRKIYKLVSSSARERVEEFLTLWENEDVKYIITARGGEFLMEIFPYMDVERIKNAKPKWVQGFSDTSGLLFYLTTNFNIATMHGSNFSTYGMKVLDTSLIRSLEFAQNPEKTFEQVNYEYYEEKCLYREKGCELEPFNLTERIEYKNLYRKEKEHIEGRLIGGCIDTIKSIIGTKWDNTEKFCNQFEEGMIWYLENCEMSLADLYRALWQMKNADWFKNAKGFLIGRTRAKDAIGDFSYEDVLHNIFDEMKVPVIYDVDIGHVAPQWTIINGGYAKFDYINGSGKIEIKNKILPQI